MSKNPIGRPTKYKKKYCEMLIEHMAKGLSYESFAGKIEVSRDTLYEWEKEHKDFSDSKKIGLGKGLLKMEEFGIEGMTGGIKDFKPNIWIFKMKNKHGWRDKTEISGDMEYKHTSQIKRLDGSIVEYSLNAEKSTDE